MTDPERTRVTGTLVDTTDKMSPPDACIHQISGVTRFFNELLARLNNGRTKVTVKLQSADQASAVEVHEVFKSD